VYPRVGQERHEVRAIRREESLYVGGHEAELDKLAGARATVKGSVMGETMTGQSVATAKNTAK
jgi:hypothetical protein